MPAGSGLIGCDSGSRLSIAGVALLAAFLWRCDRIRWLEGGKIFGERGTHFWDPTRDEICGFRLLAGKGALRRSPCTRTVGRFDRVDDSRRLELSSPFKVQSSERARASMSSAIDEEYHVSGNDVAIGHEARVGQVNRELISLFQPTPRTATITI